ncbi:putative DNA-binding transcriptional regulator AlpA [Chryseobacterium defluvii]|uniref:Putative DNA-binding transcriptional regulator AlpA n=1 Tax=Chryseobacterium defluvii TaxID=160396 RepID=A0A840KGA4_9FLAO|nr:helix-turn-helix domain-containing protein [Chryseobacterium defluvii]MBB4807007.1 putative DNA-binding transcriptional regulator AlpA [Chryseobacterium defluvii]
MIQLISISKDELMQEFEQIVYKVLEKMQQGQAPKDQKDFYTREETAKLLDVSLTTLFHWNNDGTLKNTKIGKRVYYSKSEVLARLNP